MGLYRFRQTFRIFGQVVLLQQLQRVSQLLAQIGVKGAGPLHQALATDATIGTAFRRSAGLTGRAAVDSTATHAWWVRALAMTLDLEVGKT